ncbi:hypothetical protein SynRCC2555_02333 [Synechococcus sp. WH 8101]|nr:hypothetical protein SynRCC2555_02333 [Synechococcus sp. WH 8101]
MSEKVEFIVVFLGQGLDHEGGQGDGQGRQNQKFHQRFQIAIQSIAAEAEAASRSPQNQSVVLEG